MIFFLLIGGSSLCCLSVFSVKRVCEEKEQRVSLLEESLASAQKEVSDLRSCLREVERSRLEARRELQELRRQVRPERCDRGALRARAGV